MKARWMALVTLLAAVGPAVADDRDDVVKAWAARRAEVRNVWVELDIEFSRKKDTDPKSKNLLGQKDYTSKTQQTLILDFEKGRSRKHEVGELFSVETMANRPYDATQAFDGTTLRTVGVPPPGQKTIVGNQRGFVADYGEYTGDLSGSTYRMEVMPIFFSCGLVPMKQYDRFWPGQFHKYDMTEWIDVLSLSSRTTPLPNARWFSLPATNSYKDYLVDTSARHRLLEMVAGRKGQNPDRRLTVSYGKVGSVEGPVSWEYWESLDYGGEGTVRCVVRKIAYNVPLDDSLFTCSPSEGMTAVKLKFPDPGADPNCSVVESGKFFRVEDGQRLVEIDSPMPGATPGRNRSNVSFWWWAGGVTAAALVTSVLFVTWWRRRRASANLTPPTG